MNPLCPHCQSSTKRFGRSKDGYQRYRCLACSKTFADRPARPLGASRLPLEEACRVLQLLCEGTSIRAVERLTGYEKGTVLRLLAQVGPKCERLLESLVRDVEVTDVQCDELHGWVHCKQGTKARKGITNPEAGDCWTWVALERGSKLVLSFHVGRRTTWDAHDFMAKLAKATSGRFALSTDGWAGYPETAEYHLGARIDYGMVIKEYRQAPAEELRRYAPPRLLRVEKVAVSGEPDEKRMCTSHVERCNWTIRTHLRRLTRLSNGFSRKKSNLRAAVALFFAYYNLVKFHGSIRMTPAMKAGIVARPWTMADLVMAAGAAA
jgi:transposase-like protein/IS1 family transposase